MAGPHWDLFAIGTGLAVILVVSLTRATRRMLAATEEPGHTIAAEIGQRELVLNILLTHGLLAGGVLLLAWGAAIPYAHLGLRTVSLVEIGIGIALGIGLAILNESIQQGLNQVGIEVDARLREWLTPDSARGWAVLLGVVLPIVAISEELLFRAALIGVPTVAYSIPDSLMIVVAAIPFGLAHGIQGRPGMIVAGGLGVVLGWAFVLSGSLTVVVVAHLLVNTIEFLSNA